MYNRYHSAPATGASEMTAQELVCMKDRHQEQDEEAARECQVSTKNDTTGHTTRPCDHDHYDRPSYKKPVLRPLADYLSCRSPRLS